LTAIRPPLDLSVCLKHRQTHFSLTGGRLCIAGLSDILRHGIALIASKITVLTVSPFWDWY